MNEGTTLAVVEDDVEIRGLLAGFLEGEGFRVECFDGGSALGKRLAQGHPPDLIILDWMLPGEDGLSICRRLRDEGGPPVVMLTAKDEDIDLVLGLEMGADDYVSKPFNPRVLLARVRAVLRRAKGTGAGGFPGDAPAQERLRVADLVVDPASRSVHATADMDMDGEYNSKVNDILFVCR